MLSVLIGIVIFFVVVYVGFKALAKYKNRRLQPDSRYRPPPLGPLRGGPPHWISP